MHGIANTGASASLRAALALAGSLPSDVPATVATPAVADMLHAAATATNNLVLWERNSILLTQGGVGKAEARLCGAAYERRPFALDRFTTLCQRGLAAVALVRGENGLRWAALVPTDGFAMVHLPDADSGTGNVHSIALSEVSSFVVHKPHKAHVLIFVGPQTGRL